MIVNSGGPGRAAMPSSRRAAHLRMRGGGWQARGVLRTASPDLDIRKAPTLRPFLELLGEHSLRSFANTGGEFPRRNDSGMTAPTEDPALHFGQAGQFHAQLRAAAFQFAQLL